jgi:cellulose synthase/poly-beta-1,6-N-acetylglucosamine synthase-like glycosyltransferase
LKNSSRATGLFVLLGLALFLVAKAEVHSSSTSNALLYGYGVTVTSAVLVQMFIAFHRYRDPAVSEVENGELSTCQLPRVSCVVAVHNEQLIIEQCVASLVSQRYQNKEIIVVDDASTDRTLEILNQLQQAHPIKVLAMPRNVGKKRALASAMLEAEGDIFAFSDSDSVWAPDALERTVGALVADDTIGAVSGHCRALNRDRNLLTRVQDTWYEGQFSVRKAFESVFGAVTCVSGPLAVFRKEAIYNFMPAWEEDQFLGKEFRFATDRTLTGFVLGAQQVGQRLKERHRGSPFLAVDYPLRNWRIVYCKSARAWTEVPDTLSRLIKQQVRWKKSFLRNLCFTGRFYWRRPLLAVLVYYLHIAFVLLGPFVAFRHLVYMPVRGNVESMVLYLSGIVLIGFMFGLAYRREDSDGSDWVYRPLMSLLSTAVLSWLVFYSMVTIRRTTWARS